MFVDLHTHSKYSHDSRCEVVDIALSQKSKGTFIFAVTDHFDYPNRCDEESVKKIINSAFDVRNTKVEGVEILAGVELGRGDMCQKTAKELFNACNFDLVIGSVHSIEFNGKFLRPSSTDFSLFSDEEIRLITDNYFAHLYKAIEFGCDTVAHISYLARYVKQFDINENLNKFKDAFKMIIEKDIALEVNTGYLKKNNCDFAPSRELLKLYWDMGGRKITLGSDAHTTENASFCFKEAKEMLSSLNIKTAFYFKNRKPIEYEI